MPPNLHPHNIDYLRHLLLGFSSFVVLCGIKAVELTQQSTVKRGKRANWGSVEETHLLIDLLLERKARMGQSGSFPMAVFSEVAHYLSPDKDASNVATKFAALKRTCRAIEAYINSSGHGEWSETHGANISDIPEDNQAWEQYISTSVDGKELVNFRNIGWPYFSKMQVLLASSSGAVGISSYLGPKITPPVPGTMMQSQLRSHEFDDDESVPGGSLPFTDTFGFDEPASGFFSSQMIASDALPGYEAHMDLNHLLNLGRNVTSPNPTTQLAAVHDAMSAIKQIGIAPLRTSQPSSFFSETGKRTFEDMSCSPPSSRTSLVSSGSKISKVKSRPRTRTSAASARSSSVGTSASVSKRSKVTHAESTMANAVAMSGMTSAINRAADCIMGMQDLLVVPTAPSLPVPTSPPSVSFRSLATAHLNSDVELDIAIRTELAIEFFTNEPFCQVYAELMDPLMRRNVAMSWYRKRHPVPPSASFFSGVGDGASSTGPSGTHASSSSSTFGSSSNTECELHKVLPEYVLGSRANKKPAAEGSETASLRHQMLVR